MQEQSGDNQNVVIQPKIESFTLDIINDYDINQLYSRLSTHGLYNAAIKDNALYLYKIDGYDLQKRPFNFSIFIINGKQLQCTYTIQQDTSPKMRKLNVIKDLLLSLELVDDLLKVDTKKLYDLVASSISEVLSGISQQYSVLYNAYDALLSDYKEVKKQLIDLKKSNDQLATEADELRKQNAELSKQLSDLNKYSDEALMAMIEDWIRAHDGSIDIMEFSKTYKLTPSRVEQILNIMVAKGYIAPIS
ncbi:MAG: hypothetical protein ARM1_0454 [Candidatus Micrarchaeota archaeon]|nr:MAG: hypothetical protein ARM1_0454 [Candidatus Micrarchaeota archaeon]